MPAASTPDAEHLIVIQPTPFCNIDCSYCYLHDRAVSSRMSAQTLGAVLDAVFQSRRLGHRITFVWHAGEPLTAGRAFFEHAFAETARRAALGPKRHISHSIQTNGLLLDARWLELFRRYQVQLGLSIDGPKFLHDRHRKTRDGRGTHAAAMRAVKLLEMEGYPFSALMVVTREALAHADAIYDFFCTTGARSLGLNVEESEGAHASSSLADRRLDAEVRAFWRRLLQRQRRNPPGLPIREFGRFGRLLQPGTRIEPRSMRVDNDSVRPFAIVSFDVNGRVGVFCPELLGAPSPRFGDFVLGHIGDVRIDEVLDSARGQLLAREIAAGVERCRRECSYFAFCGGGQPANKFFEHGRFDVTETAYCRTHEQRVVDAVIDQLEEEAPAPVT